MGGGHLLGIKNDQFKVLPGSIMSVNLIAGS